jgi:hypothetical protein
MMMHRLANSKFLKVPYSCADLKDYTGDIAMRTNGTTSSIILYRIQ